MKTEMGNAGGPVLGIRLDRAKFDFLSPAEKVVVRKLTSLFPLRTPPVESFHPAWREERL